MILSSEPGVYVPGHAGYRISDTVLVTESGPRRLTAYPPRAHRHRHLTAI
ncbi:M24 family metallopeptidase [Nonomuraea salmonea]